MVYGDLKEKLYVMDPDSACQLPPPEAPLAIMETEKTPPRSPAGLPPPPNEK